MNACKIKINTFIAIVMIILHITSKSCFPSLLSFSCIKRECHQVLQMTQGNKSRNETYYQFEGGVKLGIGAFNLV